MDIEIIDNHDHEGIEIWFEENPGQDIIHRLIDLGFRWNKYKHCWYIKKYHIENDPEDYMEFLNYLISDYYAVPDDESVDFIKEFDN